MPCGAHFKENSGELGSCQRCLIRHLTCRGGKWRDPSPVSDADEAPPTTSDLVAALTALRASVEGLAATVARHDHAIAELVESGRVTQSQAEALLETVVLGQGS